MICAKYHELEGTAKRKKKKRKHSLLLAHVQLKNFNCINLVISGFAECCNEIYNGACQLRILLQCVAVCVLRVRRDLSLLFTKQ